ncbi:hypothetical protein HDZ31DRAFT_81615 [Schizophyllum fasciatum]
MLHKTKQARDEREFPHPFVDRDQYGEEPPGTWAPRAIVELRMQQLSAALREKPEWWRKAKDPKIRKRWFEEAKAEQESVERRWRLTDNMINYTLSELEGYAQLRDEETGIECGPYDCIWRSDRIIPDGLCAALEAAVKPLEDVPDAEKDWHPGSNEQVLDLVHPFLYPLIYGQTLGKRPNGTVDTFDPPETDFENPGDPLVAHGPEDAKVLPDFVSSHYQCLPSDFLVQPDGSVRLASAYINNVAPEHAGALVPAFERVLARAVPLWERVLGDLRGGEPPMRVGPVVYKAERSRASKGLACVWREREPEWVPSERVDDTETWEEYRAARDAWYATQPVVLPEAPAEYEGALAGRVGRVFGLRGRTIQVITKLVNVVLTPEKPTYPGGTWHVEGMWNERIVSTFIYYYRSENVQDTQLAFRQATAEALYHRPHDDYCMATLYGFEDGEACVQDVGSITTKPGRCVAFPNLLQHKVAPFGLVDPTQPGVRKILVFYLVDPTRPVPSATVVAPQQEDWLKSMLYAAQRSGSSRLSSLPSELLDSLAHLVPGILSREEALKIRSWLMKERSVEHQHEENGLSKVSP